MVFPSVAQKTAKEALPNIPTLTNNQQATHYIKYNVANTANVDS